MWVVNKLYLLEEAVGHTDCIEIPFFSSFPQSNIYDVVPFKAILVDSTSNASKEVCVKGFSDLIMRLRMLNAYGYTSKIPAFCNTDEMYRYHHVISVSKQAFKFLSYIDSVKIVPTERCKGNISNIRIGQFMQVSDLIDDHGSLLIGCIARGGGGPNFEIRELSCTLFDAVCLTQNSCKSDGFYLPAMVEDKNGNQDYSYVCEIKATNLEKAQAMVARSRTLRPNLFEIMWPFGKE